MTRDERIAQLELAIAAHYEAMAGDPVGVLSSVNIGGRVVEYKDSEDMWIHLNNMESTLAQLKRSRDGVPSFGRSAGVFTRDRC